MKPIFTLVCAAFTAGALLASCSAPTLKEVSGSLVQTDSGSVLGYAAEQPVIRWFDIPYAQPPVGDLRWRAPQPLDSDGGALARFDFPVMCPQQPGETSGTSGDGIVGQEDCLYLDVVAPADYASRKHPVMFWIHGGANTSGHKGTYDFSALAARENLVVVTINYRLGPLGWFTHPALGEGRDELDASGNFGTLDIIAALEWTQRNIASFGGDPDNVTIFGESAGGRNVYSMLASPLSNGLFHKAIAQSPTVQSYTPSQAYNAEREYPHVSRGSWEVLDVLGMDNESVGADGLRGVSAQQLLGAYFDIHKDHAEPLIVSDGTVIPEVGLEAALADPRFSKHTPVMAGSNRDALSLYLSIYLSLPVYLSIVLVLDLPVSPCTACKGAN